MDTTRTFVAIHVGDPAISVLSRLIRKLGKEVENIRLTPPQQFHMTLKFLGETDNRELPELCKLVRAACEVVEPFGVEVTGLGTFPKGKPPRVVWAGVGEGSDKLEAIHQRLDESMTALGFAADSRRFNPHLTLGRVGKGADAELVAEHLEQMQDLAKTRFEVDEVVLMASIRERGKIIYEPIETIEL